MIEKLTGPDCPRCGSRDSQVIARHQRWSRGRAAERRQCNHCGQRFLPKSSPPEGPEAREVDEPEQPDERADVGVTYTLCRCPSCQSHHVPAIKTIKSEPPVVHKRRCRDCGRIFRSSAE